MYEYRCDERLQVKVEGCTSFKYTGLCGGLEHLKIETRLKDERFASQFPNAFSRPIVYKWLLKLIQPPIKFANL